MSQNNNPPIFERFELDSGVSLSVNSNRKLKNIIVKVFVMADLDEGYTSRSLVPMVLRRGTTRLPDMQALRRYRESLYGCALSSSVTKVGDCMAPGTIAAAVFEGHRYARELDEPNPADVPFKRERIAL